MENTPENVSTTEQKTQEIKVENKDKKVNTLVLVIGILVVILFLTGAFFSYKMGYLDKLLNIQRDQQENEENITEEEEEEEISEDTYFEGETVKALLPEGWTVQEYYDGEGTDSLVEGTTYEGLTGLKILNGSKEIFSLRAVTGIGIVGCPMYPKFSDFNPVHLEENQGIADEIDESMNVTDYTDTEYVQFEWLGKTFRRIDSNYFYDDITGNEYFEPICMSGLLTLQGLNFTDSSGFTGEAYFFGASSDATEEELLVVDKILESMELQ